MRQWRHESFPYPQAKFQTRRYADVWLPAQDGCLSITGQSLEGWPTLLSAPGGFSGDLLTGRGFHVRGAAFVFSATFPRVARSPSGAQGALSAARNPVPAAVRAIAGAGDLAGIAPRGEGGRISCAVSSHTGEAFPVTTPLAQSWPRLTPNDPGPASRPGRRGGRTCRRRWQGLAAQPCPVEGMSSPAHGPGPRVRVRSPVGGQGNRTSKVRTAQAMSEGRSRPRKPV